MFRKLISFAAATVVLSHFTIHSSAQELQEQTDIRSNQTTSKNLSTTDAETESNNSASSQQIYKVVDNEGNITFTDKPSAKAKPVELRGRTQNVASGSKPTFVPSPSKVNKRNKNDFKVAIQAPEPEATIRNNAGDFTITAVQQGKSTASTYRLIFDGAAFASNNSGVFKLQGIDRGAHTYKVELTDNRGKTLASSPQQTLYLHKASVLIGN